MSHVTETRCDRCGTVLGSNTVSGYGVSLTVGYHHPKKLDLCQSCEGEFALWLGKHPLWDTPLEDILAGLAQGQGYPSKEQIEVHKNHAAILRDTDKFGRPNVRYEPFELPCPHHVPCAYSCQGEAYKRVRL